MPASDAVAAQTDAVGVLLLVAVILVGALFARAMVRVWISTALYLVIAGLVRGPSALGWSDVAITSSTFGLLASLALATVLFSDASSTNLRGLRLVASQPWASRTSSTEPDAVRATGPVDPSPRRSASAPHLLHVPTKRWYSGSFV